MILSDQERDLSHQRVCDGISTYCSKANQSLTLSLREILCDKDGQALVSEFRSEPIDLIVFQVDGINLYVGQIFAEGDDGVALLMTHDHLLDLQPFELRVLFLRHIEDDGQRVALIVARNGAQGHFGGTVCNGNVLRCGNCQLLRTDFHRKPVSKRVCRHVDGLSVNAC